MCFAVDTPAGLVCVQHARTFGHLTDFLVPTFQHSSQTMPKMNQSARRQLEKKLRVENRDDLRERRIDEILPVS